MSSETKSFCACSQEKTPKKVSFYFFSPKKKTVERLFILKEVKPATESKMIRRNPSGN